MAIRNPIRLSRAVFFDKDGTLTPDIPYNADPNKVTLYRNTIESLAKLRSCNYKLIVATNQSGIARGYFTTTELERVFDKLYELLGAVPGGLDAIYYCPHHPEGAVEPFAKECSCRKPRPGLLTTAAKRQNIDLSRSWMIGDILDDIEAGKRAGCRTIFINNGHETEWASGDGDARTPGYTAQTIEDAVKHITHSTKEII